MPVWVCKECRETADQSVCTSCKELLPLAEFERPKWSQKRIGDWRCGGCRYPTCVECGQVRDRSLPPVPPDEAFDKRTHRCDACREALEKVQCCSCNEALPRAAFAEERKQKRKGEWRCEGCRYPTCTGCGQERDRSLPPAQSKAGFDKLSFVCDACNYPPCTKCGETPRPHRKKHYSFASMPVWFCAKCAAREKRTAAAATAAARRQRPRR